VSIPKYISSSFTPYEMAVSNRILAVIFFCLTLLLMWQSAPKSAIVFVVIAYLMLAVALWFFSRCPNCRKPADAEFFFSEQSRLGFLERKFYFGRFNLLWPDRECSECRYELDLFPEQQGG
jgi:hypothetical protein